MVTPVSSAAFNNILSIFTPDVCFILELFYGMFKNGALIF